MLLPFSCAPATRLRLTRIANVGAILSVKVTLPWHHNGFFVPQRRARLELL
jgi:hypothetical protein